MHGPAPRQRGAEALRHSRRRFGVVSVRGRYGRLDSHECPDLRKHSGGTRDATAERLVPCPLEGVKQSLRSLLRRLAKGLRTRSGASVSSSLARSRAWHRNRTRPKRPEAGAGAAWDLSPKAPSPLPASGRRCSAAQTWLSEDAVANPPQRAIFSDSAFREGKENSHGRASFIVWVVVQKRT
jgi:hypothetical protein